MQYKWLCQTASGAFVEVRRVAFGDVRLLFSLCACNDNIICYYGVHDYFVWPVMHGPWLLNFFWF
jgi:hypothetical protein